MMTETNTTEKPHDLAKEELDECPKGGRHEFETRQGGLGQTYQACTKCNCPPSPTGHLGAH